MSVDAPIRILQVFGSLNRGGAESLIMNIYRHIDRTKVQFDFVVHTKDEGAFEAEIRSLGGRIFRMPRYKILNHVSYKSAWQNFFERHSEIQIVHAHMFTISAVYLSVAKKYDRVAIVHSHSTHSGNSIKGWLKRILRIPLKHIAYDKRFACSQQAGKWLFGNKNFVVIKNGIDIEKFVFNHQSRIRVRNKLGINGEFVVGHVGSFTEAKNHWFLLVIFAEICKLNPNSKLLLLGDGILKNKIEAQIKALNLSDKVILLGAVDNVFDYMQAMDVFLFPSKIEGLPVVLIEAQTSDLPCVVSDHITDEADIDGLLIKISLSSSAEIWAEETIKYLFHKRGNRAEVVYQSGFDAKSIAREMEMFYTNSI